METCSMTRISSMDFFAVVVHALAERSTCLRRKVGALIVADGRILSTGYAGSPAGTPHCLDPGVGCLIGPDGGCIRTLHAETNCIAFAARRGIVLQGSVMFATCTPCLMCAKLIVNSGISRLVAFSDYRDPSGADLLKSVNIPVEVIEWKPPS